ncbi:hypothetical protein CDD80_3906 [Ophiocordyceps camponoti-rufipedis]|uniref:Asparagine-linked glycosylation protein 2 n=1 Tax=Ophiocordyceps camponoti-rufipedis TaxID=2004952 RepID=A0A2C5YZV9_9HYPO|nr:hypothetical protein CDD80_3906 [Ophiocordyceps camponoti-rufipedis]
MLAARPVLAANSGGPVETVRDGRTGWLRDPRDVDAWSDAMHQALALSDAERKAMGDEAAARVRAEFGRDVMARRLHHLLDVAAVAAKEGAPARLASPLTFAMLIMFFLFGAVLSAACMRLFRG